MTQSQKLYKGNAEIFIPPGKGYRFNADNSTTKITDQNGMPIDFHGKSPGIINVVSKSGFWAINYQETNHHPSDEVPVEVPLEQPPNVMQRMQDMVREMVFNKYGQESVEMETMEEAMNFDLDEDGHIGAPPSPYELPDEEVFNEEVLATPPPAVQTPPPAEPTPVVEETPPVADPTTGAETPTP